MVDSALVPDVDRFSVFGILAVQCAGRAQDQRPKTFIFLGRIDYCYQALHECPSSGNKVLHTMLHQSESKNENRDVRGDVLVTNHVNHANHVHFGIVQCQLNDGIRKMVGEAYNIRSGWDGDLLLMVRNQTLRNASTQHFWDPLEAIFGPIRSSLP
jgi:hypothetical protein